MDIILKTREVNITNSRINGYIDVSLIDVDKSDILEKFTDKEILDTFDTFTICKHFDHSELLDEMNIDVIKEYLKINEETEL